MAYAFWATPNKTSGNGNDTVSWTGAPHTGRAQRTTTATFSAAGVSPQTLTIVQKGKTEFVSVEATASISQSGGIITIHGFTNSSKLTAEYSSDNIGLPVIESIFIDGADVDNGEPIPGDPGATMQAEFSIGVGASANPGVTPRTAQLIITDNAGHTATCLITQTASAAYLTISPTTIELDAEGNPASVIVSSNTSWSIS